MSKPGPSYLDVKVDISQQSRRHTHGPMEIEKRGIPKVSSRSNDYVFENKAYVGSMENVNPTVRVHVTEPPTSVIREQYWACSKWPFGQRILAIAVGVLFGVVVGLTLTLAFQNANDGGIVGIFSGHPAPD